MSSGFSHVAHLSTSSFILPPDLHPLYPTSVTLSNQLSISGTLTPEECKTLVNHSLIRACTFGDLSLITFILYDERCNRWADLELRDEDGVTPIGVCIMGFRGNDPDADPEREMEREECIRLLIKEGAELESMDNSGWTPLHHAALLAPPSLVSYLLSHGASPLALSRRKLTPLDVITAYEDVPGRGGAITILREAMRHKLTFEEKQRMIQAGWRGDERREIEKRKQLKLEARKLRKKRMKEEVTSILEEELGGGGGADISWSWGNDEDSEDEFFEPSDLDDEDSDGYDSDTLVTPPDSYRTMLVFSPTALGRLFESLIPLPSSTPSHKRLRDPLAAQALYMHCRFACIACDHNWLEDLIVGSMDRIEEVVMASPNDLANLSHWLFNTTLMLHLLRCDESTAQICEILGLFGLMEELLNVVYVLVIRIIERRLDTLIDSALLDYTSPELRDDLELVQFEGEWDGWTGLLGRVINPKKKPAAAAPKSISGKMGPPSTIPASSSTGSTHSTLKAGSPPGRPSAMQNGIPGSKRTSSSSTRPSSPTNHANLISASNSGAFPSIKSTIIRSSVTPSGSSNHLGPPDDGANHASGKVTPAGPSPSSSLANLAQRITGASSKPEPPSPNDLIKLLTALHSFLSLSGVNPVLIVQIFSQVMYWTSCEMFNRILQRRKYLCRSRALHIGLNMGIIEEWVSGTVGVGLPREVGGHFRIVRELVSWLQCLSSIDQFASLIATVQTFRRLNPLQMRRAVRDYRYEVGESKMTEECSQYLAQLQKDWERQRVKMGVEALKKEMSEREGSTSSRGGGNESMSPPQAQSMSTSNSAEFLAQKALDNLFSRSFEKSDWEPAKPPAVLGELLDSRHMLPLLLPSDPMHLGALPVLPQERNSKRESDTHGFLTAGGLGSVEVGLTRHSGHRKSQSISGSQAGSRSASVASVGTRGSMQWLSRARKLRVVDRSMLKHLGDDEVASELEAINAKWHLIWDNTVAASAAGDHQNLDGQHRDMILSIEKELSANGSVGEEGASPPTRAGSPKLTLEPPRLVKEMRRRASQADGD